MKDVAEMLSEKYLEIEQTEVPDELEMRLHSALKKQGVPKRSKNWKAVKIAAVCMVLLLVGSQFDTLAFYGKKLIGYEQVMNGTLKQLNELGKGQEIGKSYSFENGVIFTLDAIMLDDNQLLAFYSIKDPGGNVENIDISPMFISGAKNWYYMESAIGNVDSPNEMKCMANFETPDLSEKDLTLVFSWLDEGKSEEGEINFILDRNKSMGHSLKKDIHQNIKVDGAKIRFESIVASPTTTVIKGSIQTMWELAWDQFTGERLRPNNLDVKLIANGKKLSWQVGGEMATDMHGITFKKEFDALPGNLEDLQIELVSFGADHDVNEELELQKDGETQSITILGQNIDINEVYELQGDTYVTISSEESVILTRVHLLIDGEKVGLEETILDKYGKKADGSGSHTRTLHFAGTGDEIQLSIERMTYAKTYNKVIEITIS